ncbi:hypothetical protein SAMN05216561_104288 [Nocardioides psychrotolerans]|uniref:histidine kinase n=2 Tax=Nocardioides psychrotolerans TaxID=1005945 RepID=A0A1I3F9V8_9ACTN|nr:hypothetical protein SAMN05216561_104288 [Nocardioides psychrotolerans]
MLVVATFVIPVTTFREVDLGVEVFSWFATVGLTAVVLILSRVGRWPLLVPLLVASAVGARISNGIELAPAVAGGSGHVAAALLATLIIVRWRVHDAGVATLERQDDVVRVLLASVAAGLLATLTEGYLITDGAGLLSTEAVAVFAARAASVLVVVPLALTLHVRRSGRLDELVLQTSLLSLVTVLTFSPGQDLPLPFVTLPLLVWGALRFDLRTVSLQLLAFSCFVAVATAQGHGVFGSARVQAYFGREGAATLSQLFLLAAALVTLPLVVAITQRTQLLAAISTEEERFRRHFTESLIGGVFLRAEGEELVIQDVNEAGTHILGASSEDLRDRRVDTVLEPLEPDLPLTPTSLRDAGTGWRGCATVRTRAGSRVELAVAALSSGSPDRTFSAQLLDVTAEHEARRRLEAAQSLTTATLDSAACVIMVTDTSGTIVRVNGATSGITGYDHSELVGQPVWRTSIAPMERADVETLFVSPHLAGAPLVRERRGTTKAGEALRLVWSSNVVRDEVGVPSYAVLTGIDVTAERASTDLVAHLMQATLTIALIGIDTVGRITVFNAGAEHLLGYRAGEIVGQPFAQFIDPAQLLERTGSASIGEALLSVLTVHDTGLGIPEDEFQAVFDKFFRTAVAQKRAIPGTGLGLSIVASIVKAHAGTIEVSSAPGQGTVFTVHLPQAP